jgi:hypothetical protein
LACWRFSSSSCRKKESTWGFSCCGQPCDLFRSRPGFDPLCARMSPRGALPAPGLAGCPVGRGE